MMPRELRILSIDASLRSTGIYWYDRGNGEAYRIETTDKMSRNDRLVYIGERFFALVRARMPIDIALIEAYAYGQYSSSVTRLAEVGGIIRFALASLHVPIVEIVASQARRLTVGKLPGKSTKAKREQYLSIVEKYSGKRFQSTDCADAYLLFRAAMRILYGAGSGAATESLREIVSGLQKVNKMVSS